LTLKSLHDERKGVREREREKEKEKSFLYFAFRVTMFIVGITNKMDKLFYVFDI